VLILAGWFANPTLEARFLNGAEQYAPSVKVKVVDGRRADVRQEVWHAADVFTSLSDNIQETFGLTPIEAMAAGLPVVISDWNGYRDTVRHGIDGFLVPTYMPAPGLGAEIAARFSASVDTYDRYIAQPSQCTAVDVAKCAACYAELIERPDLRKQFGEAGRQRAREAFSWKGVIAAYQELWREMAAIRAAAPATSPAVIPHPLRDDPLALFGHYATSTLTDDMVIEQSTADALVRLPALYADPLVNYAGSPAVLAELDDCRRILDALHAREHSIGDIAYLFSADRRPAVIRSLGWFLKCGLIKLSVSRLPVAKK
jgi:hypothetical protein